MDDAMPGRQPVHTVYGGAHLFRAEVAEKLGGVARRALEAHAPDAASLQEALGTEEEPAELWERVYGRVVEKLEAEPVEDFRIDFEDGYGYPPVEEEDAVADTAADELARAMEEELLPPFVGIRIKPFSAELVERGKRTLRRFVRRLAGRTGGELPANFVVTLPKVAVPEQVGKLIDLFEELEEESRVPVGALKAEIMVETPRSIMAADGRSPLPVLVRAGRGRCVAAHFGVYDYTASLGITAAHQELDHPACDFARHMMQVALGDLGIMLSDGATNVLPVGDPDTVRRAWRLHYRHVRHSLAHGWYQGWDLNPAQLPTRYAAVYAFFLEQLEEATGRLAGFLRDTAQATLSGEVMDDAATGGALLTFFRRGLTCGAITEEEVRDAGVTPAELAAPTLVSILESRSA